MKKRFVLLMAVWMVMSAIPTHAVQARAQKATPSLSFTGTTANCAATVTVNQPTDEVEAEIGLWHGDECIASWEKSSTGFFSFSDTVVVSRGQTYTLTLDATINGKTLPSVSVTKTCK